MTEPDYCGCCGNEAINRANPESPWCGRCAGHVTRRRRVPLWEQTYEARHGKPCPHQVGP